MSKDKARGEQSYKDEELLLGLVPVVLEQNGFTHVRVERRGGMKFIDARTLAGEAATLGSAVRIEATSRVRVEMIERHWDGIGRPLQAAEQDLARIRRGTPQQDSRHPAPCVWSA